MRTNKISKLIISIFTIFSLFLLIVGCTPVNPGTDNNQGNNNGNSNNNNNNNNNNNGNSNPATNNGAASSTFTLIDPKPDYDKEIDTKSFKTQDELLSFIRKNSGGNSYVNYYFSKGGPVMMENSIAGGTAVDSVKSAPAPTMARGESGSSGSAPAADYSQTNNQVASVDEADIMKSDGKYIYTITGNVLYIVQAYPGEDAKVVSTLKFKSTPSSIFIKDDTLAVFGNFYDTDFFKKAGIRPKYGMSFLNLYDVSDKEDPKLLKEYKFEGNYFDGRMKGSYMYLLTTSQLDYRRDWPMPLVMDGLSKVAMPINNIYYYNIPYQNPIFANIHAVNLDSPKDAIKSVSIAVEGSNSLYMSEDNIYVTYTQYINEYEIQQEVTLDLLKDKITKEDQDVIDKIESTDDDVLSTYEKKSKIYQVYMDYMQYMSDDERQELQDNVDTITKQKMEDYKHTEFTVINKISIDEDNIKPAANGKVPGHIVNQFSMDEYDKVLRIATTLSPRWWSRFTEEQTTSTNNIYTLDKNLEILDSAENIAKGEQIYSTRFIEGRLYMVTFRQVDPFFVYDLSNPENIKELGKLKVPGFSRYLHPYDENTIIGIGQDSSETGQQRGLKISLFNVEDVENPVEIAKYVSADQYAQTSAQWEHKAFLFSKDKELLVIPAYNYDYSGNTEHNYNGAMVFHITKDEITLRGLVDHSNGANNGYYWQPAVERSMYIEDMLYTKSPNLLRINEIDTLQKVKNIELNENGNPDMKIY